MVSLSGKSSFDGLTLCCWANDGFFSGSDHKGTVPDKADYGISHWTLYVLIKGRVKEAVHMYPDGTFSTFWPTDFTKVVAYIKRDLDQLNVDWLKIKWISIHILFPCFPCPKPALR